MHSTDTPSTATWHMLSHMRNKARAFVCSIVSSTNKWPSVRCLWTPLAQLPSIARVALIRNGKKTSRGSSYLKKALGYFVSGVESTADDQKKLELGKLPGSICHAPL